MRRVQGPSDGQSANRCFALVSGSRRRRWRRRWQAASCRSPTSTGARIRLRARSRRTPSFAPKRRFRDGARGGSNSPLLVPGSLRVRAPLGLYATDGRAGRRDDVGDGASAVELMQRRRSSRMPCRADRRSPAGRPTPTRGSPDRQPVATHRNGFGLSLPFSGPGRWPPVATGCGRSAAQALHFDTAIPGQGRTPWAEHLEPSAGPFPVGGLTPRSSCDTAFAASLAESVTSAGGRGGWVDSYALA